MKRLSYVLVFFFFIFNSNFLKAQIQDWVVTGGSTAGDLGNAIISDADGYIYTIGSFTGTVDFDNGSGVFNVTSSGTSGDCFVLKTNSQGDFQWVKVISGSDVENPSDIALGNDGAIYITGSFYQTVDFDPGIGVENKTAVGSFDMFIVKLSATGDFVWVRTLGSASGDLGRSVKLDSDGNVYTTGNFKGTIDFDPGTGVVNLTSKGDYDIFVWKLTSNGDYIWAKSAGGIGPDNGFDLAIDEDKNVVIATTFQYTADYDPDATQESNIVSAGGSDIAYWKLNSQGNLVWVKRFGNSSSYNESSNSIAIDKSGDIYTAGYYYGTVDFDPGSQEYNLTSLGSYSSLFIMKLSGLGDLAWASSIGPEGVGGVYAQDMKLDQHGNIYTVGNFSTTADFNPGSNRYALTSAGQDDIFVFSLNSLGEFNWAYNLGGTNSDQAFGITLGANDEVCITGYFTGTANFSLTDVPNPITTNGSIDFFIQKVNQCLLAVTANVVTNMITAEANHEDVTYQWVDCEDEYSWISGATQQIYTPLVSGGYAVIASRSGCVDTSSCVVISISIETSTKNNAADLVSLYPNPVANIITINSKEIFNNATISVYEMNGLLIMQYEQQHGNVLQIDLSTMPKGIYMLEVIDESVSVKNKIIKQ